MVNKCAAPSCRSGYAKNETKHITEFQFPLKNLELNRLSIRFVNCKDWKPTKHSVLCELYFEEREVHCLRWKVKFKMLNEFHTNQTFQGAAKNAIIVTTKQ